jgi:hypothetical protein
MRTTRFFCLQNLTPFLANGNWRMAIGELRLAKHKMGKF